MNIFKIQKNRLLKLPPAYFIFIILPIIALLSVGCGCSARVGTINSNMLNINSPNVAKMCINNLENGDSGTRISKNNNSDGKDYVKDFKGYIKNNNLTAIEKFKNDLKLSDSGTDKYGIPGNINDRFTAKNNNFLFSKIENVSICFQDFNIPTDCKNIKFPLNNSNGSPIPTYTPTEKQKPIPKTSFDAFQYTYDTTGRLGFLAFGGKINSSKGNEDWYIHSPNNLCPKSLKDSDYYSDNINQIDDSNFSNMEMGYIYLKLGINKENPKNTITQDSDSYIVLKFDINSVLFYQSINDKNNNSEKWDFNSDANGSKLGSQRTNSDLNLIQNINKGEYYKSGDLTNNVFLFDSYLGFFN